MLIDEEMMHNNHGHRHAKRMLNHSGVPFYSSRYRFARKPAQMEYRFLFAKFPNLLLLPYINFFFIKPLHWTLSLKMLARTFPMI